MTDQRDRELAAILAGLRLLQRENYAHDDILHIPQVDDHGIWDIVTNMQSFSPLGREEIESLCQRLNTEWDLQEVNQRLAEANVIRDTDCKACGHVFELGEEFVALSDATRTQEAITGCRWEGFVLGGYCTSCWQLMHADLDTCQERVKESAREWR